MYKAFFQLPSRFPPSRLGTVWLVTSSLSLSFLQTPACIGENIQLQTQTAKSDKLPTAVDTDSGASAQTRPANAATGEAAAQPSQDEQTRPVHKLHAFRQALLDENKDAQSSIDAQSLRAGATAPLVPLRALLGRQQQDRHQLFAERDTGYGVCGLVMNVPLQRRAYVSVRKVFPGMPAEQANLQAGDLIVSVNGTSTLDIPTAQVWDYLTGTPGTDVQLQMMRGNHPFSVTLKRMDIGHIPDEQVRAGFLTIFEARGGTLHPLQD